MSKKQISMRVLTIKINALPSKFSYTLTKCIHQLCIIHMKSDSKSSLSLCLFYTLAVGIKS